MMKVLVVIVTYNAMQWIERCLSSVKQSEVKADLFIVDNGSADGSQDYIRLHYPEAHFIQSETNLGFGKANNIGLQYALDNNYDYVYLLNQDAWIFPETLGGLIDISKKHPEYGILSPFQMNADLLHIDRVFAICACSYSSNSFILSDMYSGRMKEVYSVTFVMAAHWMMTRECIRLVGGFSPSFPHYGEDNNYIDRLLFNKLEIGIVPSLKVVHDRADRIISEEKKLYLGYIGVLRSLSTPLTERSASLYSICSSFIKTAFRFHSMKPLGYMKRILFNISYIHRNRKISMVEETAFLTKNNEKGC